MAHAGLFRSSPCAPGLQALHFPAPSQEEPAEVTVAGLRVRRKALLGRGSFSEAVSGRNRLRRAGFRCGEVVEPEGLVEWGVGGVREEGSLSLSLSLSSSFRFLVV